MITMFLMSYVLKLVVCSVKLKGSAATCCLHGECSLLGRLPASVISQFILPYVTLGLFVLRHLPFTPTLSRGLFACHFKRLVFFMSFACHAGTFALT